MAEGKKSFILYLTQRPTFEGLSDKDAGQLIKTIFSYVSDENPEPSGIVKYAFEIIKPVLKADLVKYEDKRMKLKENISKRWNKEEQKEIQKNTNEYNSIQTDSDIVNDIVIDNVIDIDNKTNVINKESVKEKSTTSRFIPPTLEQVQAYCLERNNLVDPNKWFDFYQAKGWMVGKNKMKDWKAAVRTWEKESGFKNNPNEPNDNGGFTEL